MLFLLLVVVVVVLLLVSDYIDCGLGSHPRSCATQQSLPGPQGGSRDG